MNGLDKDDWLCMKINRKSKKTCFFTDYNRPVIFGKKKSKGGYVQTFIHSFERKKNVSILSL